MNSAFLGSPSRERKEENRDQTRREFLNTLFLGFVGTELTSWVLIFFINSDNINTKTWLELYLVYESVTETTKKWQVATAVVLIWNSGWQDKESQHCFFPGIF